MTSGEQQYMAGYNAGRTSALQAGSTEDAERWLREHPNADPAYVAGYEWALWDYADANGLKGSPHEAEAEPIARGLG